MKEKEREVHEENCFKGCEYSGHDACENVFYFMECTAVTSLKNS